MHLTAAALCCCYLQVAWLPRETGAMFNFVHLEWNGGGEEEGVFVTCNRAAEQSLQSLTVGFPQGWEKAVFQDSGVFWVLWCDGRVCCPVQKSPTEFQRCLGSGQQGAHPPSLYGGCGGVHLPALQVDGVLQILVLYGKAALGMKMCHL